ncbi:hypothetical protein BGX27_004898 [Mortierella sp. AM989]|nr:hypothetical protein BGX27_004898 [Mortierella sp. AM989]
MVLEMHTTVAWFNPSGIATATAGTTTTALASERGFKHKQTGQVATTKPVTIPKSNISAIASNNDNKYADPFTVYGPAFEKVPSKTLRRRCAPLSKGMPQSTAGWQSVIPSSRSPQGKYCRQQGPVYPNDSILALSNRRSESLQTGNWLTKNDRDYLASSDEEGASLFDEDLREARRLPVGWQDMYFSEMPLELLDNIFQQFVYVSHESLSRLAEERNQARNRASKRPSCQAEPVPKRRLLPHYLSKAGWGYSDFLDAEMARERLHIHYPHQYHPCLHLSSQSAGTHGHNFASHAHHHHQQELRQRQRASNTSPHEFFSQPQISRHDHCPSIDQERDYDAEEDDDVDSESGAETHHNKLRNPGLDRTFRLDFMSDLDRLDSSDSWETDPSENSDGEEYDSTSSGSHELGFGYHDDALTDSVNTYSDEEVYDDEYDDEEPNGVEGTSITEQSRLDMGNAATATLSRSTRVENVGQTSRQQDLTGLLQCSCLSREPVASVFPRHGINRVDNELDEDRMLYQLHRDQYFNPTTHTSLRSDLYNCSLVNRQWRIAALQLLWQSVVLDSESCRIEPTDPCYCCKTFEESRTTRSRIETMLDSYFDVYNLDLSKCIQTLELDLRIVTIARVSETHAIKRILMRLSPFTHLRLIWTDKETSESQASAFEEVFGSLHSQIRHLHFSPGFVVSKAWVREMEKMVKLETITLESLGSLDVIEYDWTKIKCLRMNAVIPRSVFGMPNIPAATVAAISNIVGDYHDGALTVAIASIQAIMASTATAIVTYDTTATNITTTTTPILHNDPQSTTASALGWGTVSAASGVHGFGVKASGWWQWMGLRKIEIRIKNTVLPREWLQELVTAITQNSVILEQKQKKIQATHSRHQIPYQHNLVGSGVTSVAAPYGPPLEVLDIDCAISHPHKDIFTQLVQTWGSHFEEFHFNQSAELTDDFFWLCVKKMTRVKKLSLRESRGITGEGIAYHYDGVTSADNYIPTLTQDMPSESSLTENFSSETSSISSQGSLATAGKPAKTPIMWRHEFCELNLDQSRIRREFLETLKHHCPGVRYKVREGDTMATRDIVTSESTFFWKLIVEPTRFPCNFCESVTRYFESEPEPSSHRDYCWKCSFTEHMINGTASIDIEVWRTRVSPPQECQQPHNQPWNLARTLDVEESLPRRKGDNVMHKSESPLRQRTPALDVDNSQAMEEKEESNQQAQSQGINLQINDERPTPPQISYKAIAIHTPAKLAPIVAMFLNNTMKDNLSARDASSILYRNVYQFEIVLSEETSSDLLPSPSSCHRILDAMFHEVTITSLPTPATANIWFEFRDPEGESTRENAVAVGAHEQALVRYRYFAEWIKRERQAQEAMRRQQLESERMIHDQQQQLQWQERWRCSNTLERRGVALNGPEQHKSLRSQGQHSYTSSIEASLLRLYPKHHLYSAPQQVQLPHRHSTSSSYPLFIPAQATGAPKVNRNSSLEPSHPNQMDQPRYPQHPLPALRIPVREISLETFQVLLQYLYTGRIDISEQQQTKIKVYKSKPPEDYLLLPEELTGIATHQQAGLKTGSSRKGEISDTKFNLPPLGPPETRQMDACVDFDADIRPSFTAPLQTGCDQSSSNDPAMSMPLHVTTSWLPCSRRNQTLHNQIQQNTTHALHHQAHFQDRKQPRRRPGCSWEDLLDISVKCGLPDLQELAMNAIQYHCQMLTIRASINNNSMSEVPHNGFDEDQLDLQLALSEYIFQEFLELYNASSPRGNFEQSTVRVDIGTEKQTVTESLAPKEAGFHNGKHYTEKDQQRQQQQQTSQPSNVGPLKGLFNDPRCEEALTELCADIRIKALSAKENYE